MGNHMGIINFRGITMGIFLGFFEKNWESYKIGYQWEIYGILAGFTTNQLQSSGGSFK